VSSLEELYASRYTDFLEPCARRLEGYIKESLASVVRVDRISARAKSIDRFLKKASKTEDGNPKYNNPLSEIQDQIGARVVTFYPSDVPRIAEEVKRFFRPIENKLLIPDSEKEFGYEGQHFILLLPTDVLAGMSSAADPPLFELQIKTLFQHAWSEAEHDVGYKPATPLNLLQKRKIAFTAAQAWGADRIFDELFAELN
jgi:ppGpp synthetase/RelA/SpoT-type nucleotidyltranferase